MAVTQHGDPWGRVQRPWAFEIRVDFQDETGKIHNEVLNFPTEPDTVELDSAIAAKKAELESRLALSVDALTEAEEAANAEEILG